MAKVQLFLNSTVAELWRYGLRNELSGKKLTEAQHVMEEFVLPEIGRERFQRLTTEDINRALDRILRKSTPGRAECARGWLIRMYQYAQANRLIGDNPAEQASRILPAISLPQAWTKEEIEALLRAMNELELHNLYKAQLYTGWTFKELLGVRIDAIKAEEKKVWLPETGRWGYVNDLAWGCIQEEIELRAKKREKLMRAGKWEEEAPYLFTRRGKLLRPSNIAGNMKKIREASGVDYSQKQSINNALCKAIEAGAGVKDLQLYFGQKPGLHAFIRYRRLGG